MLADPAAADALVASFVDDDRFPARMAWLYDDHLRTAVFFENSPTRDWSDLDDASLRSLGGAPLELVRATVAADAPFSRVVTATELPRNDLLAEVFSLAPTGTGSAWAMTPPDDDRPMAGLLSSSELWFVYDGDSLNNNRRRANAVARIFLCDDFLARDVSLAFDLSLEALAEMDQASQTEPSCLTCHAALDPVAALFGGFPARSVNAPRENLARYDRWTERALQGWRLPHWYGRPLADLAELGVAVAADPRFSRCTARVFTEGLLGGPTTDEDLVDQLALAFRHDDGLRVRELAARVVGTDAYRAEDARVLRPDQLPTLLAGLLGLDATDDQLADLAWETELRLLGGGLDDVDVVEPNREPGLGHHVLLAWAARSTAEDALSQDAARSAEDRLLWTVAEPWPTADAQVREQLAAWWLRFLSRQVAPDSPEIDRLFALWQATGGADAPQDAWAVVVQALLRHPDFLLY